MIMLIIFILSLIVTLVEISTNDNYGPMLLIACLSGVSLGGTLL